MNIVKRICLAVVAVGLVSCGGPKVQEFTLKPLGNQMKFMQRELTAKAGVEIKLTLNNTSTMQAMVHNVVILEPGADADAIAKAALSAENNAVINDAVVTQTSYLKPGESETITFTITEPGRYEYICTYPGHYPAMKGVLIVE